ncbi:MAG: hypothetical protein WD896_02165 [Parcubacteria group bacterium]
MSTTKLNTSGVVTADSPKGQRAIETFRAQYNKAQLDEGSAQLLNEHPGFATYLATGIRQFSAKGPVFPVYLECEVGGKSKDQLLAEIEASGMFASSYAKDIMSKSAWQPGERETVKFARVRVRDLGFTKNPTTREIWMRMIKLGHSLCKSGDGPAIRLALKDQPRGDYFWVAMEQIAASGGSPRVFGVGRGGGGRAWLYGCWTGPFGEWSLGSEIVFRFRK